MIYDRSPFQSTIREWDREDNVKLAQKVLIYDYFISRESDYYNRESIIGYLNKSFDLISFKEWYLKNRNLNVRF